MATQLHKTLTRETTVVKDEKVVLASLTEEQGIELRLKHERSGVTISISELWDLLNKVETKIEKPINRVESRLEDFIRHMKVNAHTVPEAGERGGWLIACEIIKRSLEDIGEPPSLIG